MEYIIDVDLIGEILIPLENSESKNKTKKTFTNLEDVISKNFSDFRSIIFQGEVLRIFVVMKIDTQKNVENLLEETFFKIEFDPFCDVNEESSEKEESELGFPNENNDLFADHTITKQSDLFAVHRKTIFGMDNNTIANMLKNDNNANANKEKESDYKNMNHEFISKKVYLKEKKIAVFEILKHISNYILRILINFF